MSFSLDRYYIRVRYHCVTNLKPMNTNVTLRKRRKGDGMLSLYLDYWPPVFNIQTKHTRRHEYLHTYIYENPKDEMQRSYNKEMLKVAEAIRCQRALDIARNTVEIFDESLLRTDFLQYFAEYVKKHKNYCYGGVMAFSNYMNKKCTFGDLSKKVLLDYREHLINDCTWQHSPTKLNVNTAAKYYWKLRMCVHEAYKEHYIPIDLSVDMEVIKTKMTKKSYLTMEEVRALRDAPCEYDVLKRASLFSIMTGLRISDIRSLKWENIEMAPDGGPCIRKRMVKPDREETIYISEEALSYCGPRCSWGPVFYGLEQSMTVTPLKRWVKAAGIEKHITFHCFRHTYATLQLANGIDIYTLQRQMTHQSVMTTEVYTALVDEKKRASANAISIKG